MSYKIKANNTEKFIPKMKAMTAYEVYTNQVRGVIDSIRYQRQGMSYIAPQLGGISGQRSVIEQSVVLQTIDFEVKE
jgi:hypothetical protein